LITAKDIESTAVPLHAFQIFIRRQGCKAAPLAGDDIEHAYNLLVILLRVKVTVKVIRLKVIAIRLKSAAAEK